MCVVSLVVASAKFVFVCCSINKYKKFESKFFFLFECRPLRLFLVYLFLVSSSMMTTLHSLLSFFYLRLAEFVYKINVLQ